MHLYFESDNSFYINTLAHIEMTLVPTIKQQNMRNKLCQSLSHCLGKLWFREYFAAFKTNADVSVSM